jgi:hypothetical protein
MTNYKQLYTKFTKGLSAKTKEIFDRRFGVKTGEPETLESIGKSFSITRERVRQIEEAGFTVIRKHFGPQLDEVFKEFEQYFANQGGFKKEEKVLEDLGGKSQRAYVLFLLTLGGDRFSRVTEKRDFHYFWATLPEAQQTVKAQLASIAVKMDESGKPIAKKDFYTMIAQPVGLSESETNSYLEVSKRIQPNKEGDLGLADWPEIKPRGVKDKAFLVFKKHGKPLHFTEVAQLIDKHEYSAPNKKTYPQTVHNELIKDARFVLVGRGTYALAEWGYEPGTIKDVITNVLRTHGEPLHKDQLVDKVLEKRLVAKNTVLMNLHNRNYFDKDDQGRYSLKKGVQEA